jgi:zinc protease
MSVTLAELEIAMTLFLRCRLLALFVLLVCLASSCIVAAEEAATPLPTDPAVRIGTLANGVTYWVRPHATPPGKITLWLRMGTGSLNEEDGQEGLAHYLEHMAFKGTEHFPAGALISYFESIGLRFGQHQNAFTGFDQTTYTLSLPDTRPETLDKGLLYLADIASRMLLAAEDVDKERGVILEEKRARKGVQQRLTDKLLPELLPGSRAARRLPIGLEETIAHLQRDDFVAYYTTWYRPEKVAILAVGDAPAEAIVEAITKNFAAWTRPQAAPADKGTGIQPYDAILPIVVTDPELTTSSLEALALRPRTPVKTVADVRRQLLERLGVWMVNRRIEQRIREGTAPYQRANVSQGVFLGTTEQLNAGAEAAPAAWEEALTALITDVQQARLHGFADQELVMAKRATMATAEHMAQTESTQDALMFIRAMNRAVSLGEQPLSAAQQVELLRQLLPGITSAEVAAIFAANFAPEHRAYVLSLPEQAGVAVPDREELRQAVEMRLAQPVAPWQSKERPTALLDTLPQPGTMVEQTRFAPLDITQVTFSNNVRVHYRFMDFKKGEATVLITLAGGAIRENAEQRGLTEMATLALSTPATTQLSSTDIRDIMTGKKIAVEGRMTDDTVVLSVAGASEALEDGLQLAHVLLQEARVEPASVALWKDQKLQELAAARTRISSRAREAAALALSGNDPRRAPLTPEQVKARTEALPTAQAWLDTLLHTAPMEVAIVGDIPESRALELAAQYLGSLPPRPRYDPSLTPLRQVAGFTGPLERALDVETITPRAHPILLWRCADWQDVRGRRLMQIASLILERRVLREVREERGLTYSTTVYAQSSKVYPDTSALHVEFTADPDKVAEAAALAKAVVERFVAEGPSDAEMDTVRKQLQNILGTTYKEPRFWIDVLSDLEYHGMQLQDLEGAIDKFLAFSKDEVAAEMRKAVVPERFAMILARPKAPSTAEERRSTN